MRTFHCFGLLFLIQIFTFNRATSQETTSDSVEVIEVGTKCYLKSKSGDVKHFDTLIMKKPYASFREGDRGTSFNEKHARSFLCAIDKPALLKKNDTLEYRQYAAFKFGKKIDSGDDLKIRQASCGWQDGVEMTGKHYHREVVFSDSIGETVILRYVHTSSATTTNPGMASSGGAVGTPATTSSSDIQSYYFIFVHGDEYVELRGQLAKEQSKNMEWIQNHLEGYPEVVSKLKEIDDHFKETGVLIRTRKQNKLWEEIRKDYLLNSFVEL